LKQQKTNSVNNSINHPLTSNNVVDVTEFIWRVTSFSKTISGAPEKSNSLATGQVYYLLTL